MTVRSIRRILFAIPIAGAMMFGTSQLFAAPAQSTPKDACPEELCTRTCGPLWYCDGLTCVCI